MFVLASTVGDVAGPAGTVIAAVLGVWAAYIGTRKIRSETVPARPSSDAVDDAQMLRPDDTSGTVLSREVEGYIVRFIIFYLTVQAWTAVVNVSNPFVAFGGSLVGLSIGFIYAAIFVVLGLPLLIDIGRRYGFRGIKRRA